MTSRCCWNKFWPGKRNYKSEERGTNMRWDMERILKVIDPKQLQQLREHERETGQPIEAAILEALKDWSDSVITRQCGIERHNRN
jgi:hypothetical protein